MKRPSVNEISGLRSHASGIVATEGPGPAGASAIFTIASRASHAGDGSIATRTPRISKQTGLCSTTCYWKMPPKKKKKKRRRSSFSLKAMVTDLKKGDQCLSSHR